MVLDGPREPEEGEGDEDSADIGERKAVFGFRFAIVAFREGFVDGVDPGHNEPYRKEEAQARAEIHQAYICGVVAVSFAPDVLEVGVEAIGCAEEDGLVGSHGKDDGLSE